MTTPSVRNARPGERSASPGSLGRPKRAQPRISAWHLVTAGASGAVVALSAYGGGDPDLFWHRVLGGAWLDAVSVQLPADDPISYSDGRPWVPTAWSVEVLYDRVVALSGYAGIGALRLVLTLLLVAIVVRYLISHLQPERAALVLILVGVPLALDIQDRPQTFSFVLAAAALPAIHRWYESRQLPGLPTIVLFTWIWANVHGLWVLVPVSLGIALAAELYARDRWRAAAGRLAVALAAGSLTPVGPELLVVPFRVRSSAGLISEWQPTSIGLPFTLGFASCVLILFVASMTRGAQPMHRVLYVAAITTFGMLAFRNVIVSSILLLPAVVCVLRAWKPAVSSALTVPKYAVVLAGGLLLGAGAATYLREPVISESNPSVIAERLAGMGTVRVLNEYNISGYLREFGGENVRLAIDGRADRWGGDRIRRYGDMTEGIRGWRHDFARYDPDVVVIHRRSPLREHLSAEGWRADTVDGNFVLMIDQP